MGAVFIECILMIFVAVVSYYLIPFLKEKKLYNAVVIAVRAAEQIFNESGKGKEKFNYVKEWIQSKFSISDEDLKNIIESAVYQLNSITINSGGEK